MVIALVCCLAGEGMAQKKGFWKSIVAYLDSSNVKGVDPAYITQPDKPWALVLNSNTGQTDLEVSTTMVTQTYKDEITINLDVKPPVSSSIGLWAGYRGWGAGYSLSLSGNSGYNFDLSMVSTSYGINLSIKRFSFDKPRNSFSYSEADGSVVNSGAFDDEMMDSSTLMGYAPMTADGPASYTTYEQKDPAVTTEFVPLMQEYLDLIVELCKENDIRLMLVDLPGNEMNDAINNTRAAYAEKNGIEYYNLCSTEYYNKIGAVLPRENVVSHENIWGAIKTSRFVGSILAGQ